MSLLDEIIVQGLNQSLTHSIASALSGGVSGAIGQLATGGMLNGLKFSDPQLQAMVAKLKGQLPQNQQAPPGALPPGSVTPPPPTDVSGVTVTANPGALASPGGAVGQALAASAGQTALAGGQGTDVAHAPPDQKKDDAATVSQVDVMGKAPVASGAFPPQALLLPAGLAGTAALASGGSSAAAPLADTGTPVSEVEINPPAKPVPATSGVSPTDVGLVGAGLGGGALLASGLSGDGTPGAPQGGDPATNGGGGTGKNPLPFGLDVKDLVAGGLLAGGLLGGSKGGGGNSSALTDIAANNSALGNRLGDLATAGMNGQIGGAGLNSIDRMVQRAQAAVRQRYASMGMSGSTAEMQDLQAAADSGVDLQFKIGQQMAQTGLTAIAALTGQSATIYAQLLNAATAKDTALGNALANFAGSLVHG